MSAVCNVFSCSHCGRELSSLPQYNGMLMACPYCRNMFIMQGAYVPTDVVCEVPAAASAFASGSVEGALATDQSGEAFAYILPPPCRPSGLTIIATVGLIFSGIAMLLAIFGGLNEASIIYGLSKTPQNGSMQILIYFIIAFLLMLCFVQISVGLLRRWKKARGSFFVLAMLIMLLEIAKIAVLIYTRHFQFDYRIDLFKAAGLTYLVIGVLYLQRRQIKLWFD